MEPLKTRSHKPGRSVLKTTASRRTRRKSKTAPNRYLVPLDFFRTSEIALRHARRITRENKGKLVLLHVINENMFHPRRIMPRTHTEKHARDGLKRIAGRVRLQPKEYESVVLWGRDIARTIVGHAKKLRASMIIMGTHGRTGLTRLVLGSVAERTLRYADCPVLIVKTR